jgi:hypothetical protein
MVSRHGGFASSSAGKLAAVALLTSPMFFSGIVFSTLLAKTKNISGVMAMNLLGAMTGGLLEYNSMYFGFRFLYLLAIFVYVLSISSFFLSKKISRVSVGPMA